MSSRHQFQKSSGVFGWRLHGGYDKAQTPIRARTLSYDVASPAAPMNALSTNKDSTMVVVAGRTVLRVLTIHEDGFEEKVNLRSGRTNLTFSSTDVQWHPTEASWIATAATNGAVVLWDLNKPSKSKQAIIYNDHKRTVNRVQFQPDTNVLASGAQDGSIKLFDIRMNQKEAFKTFTCNSESVRDIQFNRFQTTTLAAAFENGTIQLWDLRNLSTHERQLTVHNGPAFSCSWNPEERHWLATAGRDKTVKVWDLQQTLVKEIFTVQTIASVARVKWRPKWKFLLASCALLVDNNINVWHVQRPHIPFACFTEHKDVTTDFLWYRDQETLLSCSKDGSVVQHVFKDAQRPIDSVPPVGLAVSVHGEISFATSDHADQLKQLQSPIASGLSRIGMFKVRKQPERLSSKDNFLFAHSSMYQFKCLSKSSDFAVETVAHLGKNYWLRDAPFEELCDHNAEVAANIKLVSTAKTWSMLKLFYSSGSSMKAMAARGSVTSTKPAEQQLSDVVEVANPNALDTKLMVDKLSSLSRSSALQKRGSQTQTVADTTGTSTVGEGEGEDDPHSYASSEDSAVGVWDEEKQRQLLTIASGADFSVLADDDDLGSELSASTTRESAQDWQLPSEAFQPRHELQSRSPSPNLPSTGNQSPVRVRDPSALTGRFPRKSVRNEAAVMNNEQFLKWDHNPVVVDMLRYLVGQGDVQNAVSMVLVLGDKLDTRAVDEATLEQWFLSYIELLQRFELWSVAARITKFCPLECVNQLNLTSTLICTNCNTCRKPLQKSGWFCDRCQRLTNSCSICHETVKGLYVWCQGCGHGGHLGHIQDWLNSSQWCPAGCGHRCEYT